YVPGGLRSTDLRWRLVRLAARGNGIGYVPVQGVELGVVHAFTRANITEIDDRKRARRQHLEIGRPFDPVGEIGGEPVAAGDELDNAVAPQAADGGPGLQSPVGIGELEHVLGRPGRRIRTAFAEIVRSEEHTS